MNDAKRHHFLSLLLRAYEDAYGPLGTARYLQVQSLLQQVPEDWPAAKWKGLLAPLFSGTPQQQEQFYSLFDQCLLDFEKIYQEEVAPPLIPPRPEDETLRKNARSWRRSLIFLTAAVLFTLTLLWISRPPKDLIEPDIIVKRKIRVERFSIPPGDTLSRNLRLASDTNQLASASPRDWQSTQLGGLYRVDSTGMASYIARSDAEIGAIDTTLVQYKYSNGSDSSIYWIADIVRKPETETQEETATQDSFIAELPLPYPGNEAAFDSLRIDAKAIKREAFFQRWLWPLKAALLLLLAALAWVILRWDQYRRAKVVAELQRSDRAPYLWSPETGLQSNEFLQADIDPLLTRLRGRSPDEKQRLDLAATVQASVRAGGRIHLRYRRSSLPPDYLLLIDRHGAQDHQARLFEALYQLFVQAEVPLTRYFYEDDPKICYNENHPEGIELAELWLRHAGANLLLVGEGQGLLSNLSGRIAPWTKLLEAWPRRALLLTRPRQDWGRREKELQKLLPLLPASPGGLSAALDLFNADDPAAILPDLLKNVPDALEQRFDFEHELIPDLLSQFSPAMVDWIAACALWPTLHWDLTLYLGKVLEEIPMGENAGKAQARPQQGFANIRELTRLPWFIEGRIPDAARVILVEYLQERGLEQPLRLALAQLLQESPAPPPDSVAYDDYRLNLMLNELFLQPDPARKRELEREFERYLAAGKEPDFVALQVLNRPQTRLDVLVGQRLKKYAFKGGLPGLGWQLWTKLLGIWVMLALGLVFFKPFTGLCTKGEKVEYNEQTYCLHNSRDSLLYLEQMVADEIDLINTHNINDGSIQIIISGGHGPLSSKNKIDETIPDYQKIIAWNSFQVEFLIIKANLLQAYDSAFYLNTATRYFNKAAEFYNCSRQTQCSTLPPDSLRSLACKFFQRGAQLDSLIRGQLSIQYYRAQQLSCAQPETARTAPPDTATFVLQGIVLDALTQNPIIGAVVRLAGQRSRSGAGGRYRFRLRASSLGNSLLISASANDYEPGQLRTAPQASLPPLRLSPSVPALELAARNRAIAANTPEAYTTYLEAFPNGPFATEARQRIAAAAGAREQAAWEEAKRMDTPQGYQNFLQQYPNGAFAQSARQRLDDAAWALALRSNTPSACQDYLNKYPNGLHAEAARQCANPPAPLREVPRPVMVRVPAGSFEMGDVFGDGGKDQKDEKPVHTVRLDAFEIGRYEVSFAEYDLFCEATKRPKPADEDWGRGSRPVINVSWEDAIAYCNWLSEQHGYQAAYSTRPKGTTSMIEEVIEVNWNANGYRLPTEAEWEYAARGGGRKVRFGNGKDIADPKEINFDGRKAYQEKYSVEGEYRQKTVAVGSLNSPNALGLHDMSGNVYEWCWDWYDENYYRSSPGSNPRGPNVGTRRVLRGGSWVNFPIGCRASDRNRDYPADRYYDVGFRLVRH